MRNDPRFLLAIIGIAEIAAPFLLTPIFGADLALPVVLINW